MDIKWMDRISGIYGVTSALLVDRDGLVIAGSGSASEVIAPHSALMVQNLIDKIGIETIDKWLWTQCETSEMIISIANVDVGVLVLTMKPDANLGLVRMEARNIRSSLQDKFTTPVAAGGEA
jgi:predicted regulator of Ras-like GTPase activity (Roadblock/LC7/MglB family)